MAAIGLVLGATLLVVCLRHGADLPRACAAAGAAGAVVLLSNPHSLANGWWLCSGILAAAASVSAPQAITASTRTRAETLATAA